MNYFNKIKELQIKALDTTHIEDKYLVSYKENHFEVNKTLIDLIMILQSSKCIGEACEKYTLLKKKVYSVDDMTYLLDNKLSAFFKEDSKSSNSAFIYRYDIINSEKIDQIANVLKNLYKGYLYIAVFCINVILFGWFFHHYFDLISFSLNNLDIYTFLLVILILFLSTFFHELGHASACKYYGIKPGAVGAGIYINMIIFYADVSNIWQLTRKERVVVNLGGIYFQALLLIPCYILFFYTQSHLLGYLILCTNLNFLFVLNPFFKFDGYWIMSDILGVPNLRQRSMELVQYVFKSSKQKKSIQKPQLLSISPLAKYISLTYTILSISFMIFIFGYFIPRFVYQYIVEFPTTYNLLESYISTGVIPFDIIFYLLPKTILVLLVFVYAIKISIKFISTVIFNIKYMQQRKAKK